jgi:hypothetical protein
MGADWAAISKVTIGHVLKDAAEQAEKNRKVLAYLQRKGKVAYRPKQVDVEDLRQQCREKLDWMIAELESA